MTERRESCDQSGKINGLINKKLNKRVIITWVLGIVQTEKCTQLKTVGMSDFYKTVAKLRTPIFKSEGKTTVTALTLDCDGSRCFSTKILS